MNSKISYGKTNIGYSVWLPKALVSPASWQSASQTDNLSVEKLLEILERDDLTDPRVMDSVRSVLVNVPGATVAVSVPNPVVELDWG
jgi:hypothetical protein